MKIKELFEKDIERNIETVIKADDRENISDEVTEYVITKEIANKIGEEFFEPYVDYKNANGVWISGFFGSGKSHLLKILSYVLENKEHDDYRCGEIFAEKIEDDALLKANVLKAIKIPSESVLFNIDQQAQISSKTDDDAVLSVFYKVFYDHLGFYGSKTPVAEFEIWLSDEGVWEKFKQLYYDKYNSPWTEDRRKYFSPNIKKNMGAVLGEIFNGNAADYENIIDTIRKDSRASIDDFGNRVKQYIDSKPAGFRLNFFVDEVGQYIADNVKLMTNLQTVAETLATKCKGQSWVIVTSQEDMDKIIGDMNRVQRNDFTKIMARFKNKLPLTSANVDEVIEKRLLSKQNIVQKDLAETYKKESAHLESLLSFSDVGFQPRKFKSGEDYVNKYPFIPYQFDLFQQSRIALSNHNAFQGKHASVGERSMLGVFQEVARQLGEKDTNALVSFDMMFAGIRAELKTEIQNLVLLAEKNITNEFAIRVLKAMFLVKYFNNFKTTQRNISVLMIDDIKVDIKEHDKRVEEALNLLESQSYIQRNGDLYEYLTNDEKDIEEEIKNTDVDEGEVTDLMKDILFDEIIRDSKIRYEDNKQDYAFTKKIDGSIIGREHELEVELITPNYHDYENLEFIKAQTMGAPIMKMVLHPDSIFMRDVRMYLKTDRYVKRNNSISNSSEKKRILHEKMSGNAIRRRGLIDRAKMALADSDVYLNGAKHEMGSTSDAKTRVIKGFQALVKIAYPNLKMIGTHEYSEQTIRRVFGNNQDDLFGTDDNTMSEAEKEILNLVNRRKKQSDRTSLNDVKTSFSKKPFGWYDNAIWTLVAKLYKRGKLEFKKDSNLLEDDDAMNALLNSSFHSNTLLENQVEFDDRAVKSLKQIYEDAFNEKCPASEAKDVANTFKTKLKEMHAEVNILMAQKDAYPFLQSLAAFSEKLSGWTGRDYSYFLTSQGDFEDDLLDTKEDLLAPIQTFMNGEQKAIYDSIRTMMTGDTSNLTYIEGEERETLESLLKNDKPYLGSLIKDAKQAKDTLSKKVLDKIDGERTSAVKVTEDVIADLKSNEDFDKLSSSDQDIILSPLKTQLSKVRSVNYIGVIRDVKNTVQNELATKQLNELVRLASPKDNTGVNEPAVHYVNKLNVKPNYPKSELRTEEEVNEYVEAYKKALLEVIRTDKRVKL